MSHFIGVFNLDVYGDIIDHETDITYNSVVLTQFESKADDAKMVRDRSLYIKGDTRDIVGYFKEIGEDGIRTIMAKTKNNQKFEIKRAYQITPL